MQIVQYSAKTETILWKKNQKLFSDGINLYGDRAQREFIVSLSSLREKPEDLLTPKKTHKFTHLTLKHYIDNIHVVRHLNHAIEVIGSMMKSTPVTPNQMMNIMLKTAFVFYYANRFRTGDTVVYNVMGEKQLKINRIVKYDYENNNIRVVMNNGEKVDLSNLESLRLANADEYQRFLATMESLQTPMS